MWNSPTRYNIARFIGHIWESWLGHTAATPVEAEYFQPSTVYMRSNTGTVHMRDNSGNIYMRKNSGDVIMGAK